MRKRKIHKDPIEDEEVSDNNLVEKMKFYLLNKLQNEAINDLDYTALLYIIIWKVTKNDKIRFNKNNSKHFIIYNQNQKPIVNVYIRNIFSIRLPFRIPILQRFIFKDKNIGFSIPIENLFIERFNKKLSDSYNTKEIQITDDIIVSKDDCVILYNKILRTESSYICIDYVNNE